MTPTLPEADSKALSAAPRALVRAYAAVLGVVGTVLVVGGAVLAVEGGSVCYLVAGVLMGWCGLLTWRRHRYAAPVYGVLVVLTIAWAVYEAGATFWSLVPRLDLVVALGLPWLLPTLRSVRPVAQRRRLNGGAVFGIAALAAVLVGTALRAAWVEPREDLTMRGRPPIAAPQRLARPLAVVDREDWRHYANDLGATHFSPLADIDAGNVDKLQLAWSADTGPAIKGPIANTPSFEATPINIGDALFLCSAYDVVIALDAETGRERWRYAMTRDVPPSGKPCRGVAYAQTPNASGHCAERILAASQEGDLIALDTATGKPCADFGTGGRISLREGLGGRPEIFYYVSSAPQIVRGKAVVGGAVVDGQFWGEPSGAIRAYDVVTGKLAWAFDSGRPDQHGMPEPGTAFTPSSPNSWAPIAADDALGLVYLPMGGSVPDFYGGKRRPSDEAVATSVLALDAETGAMRWRFQTVHHDLWDYDVSGQPTLVDLPTPGGVRKALIQVTKTGQVFVLDRETGAPIKEVRERSVPQLPVAEGERLSPTQPFSVAMPEFRSPPLRESDMWGLTPIDQLVCRILFRQSRYDGPFTPPMLDRPTIYDPGPSGGMEWGGVSIDVERGIAIVNSNRVPQRVTLLTQQEGQARKLKLFDGEGPGTLDAPMRNTPFAAQANAFLSPLGVPCNAPPWGMLTAVDLVSGEVVWNQPFGTGRDSGPLGIRTHLPFTMGVPNQGGSVTTRSGLVFIGASADAALRAFDTATGKKLWEATLPGGGQANPMIFRSPKSGREFIVIAAGGKPGMNTRLSTQVVAYALPK